MYLNKAHTSLERRRRLLDSPGISEDVEIPIMKESPSRANLEEIPDTTNKIYLNKALSSLEERKRRQNALMEKDDTLSKQKADNTKSYSGVPDEDSIIQMMHKLSAEVSNTISPRRRTTRDATDAPTKRNNDPAIERESAKYRRSHSLSRVPAPPPQVYDKVRDQNSQDQISTASSDCSNQTEKRYNRTRSLSRLREEKRKGDERSYDLKPVISDLSNQTRSLYSNGENMSKRTVELEKQLEKVKSQLEMERRSRSHDINRLERQTDELLQKLNAVENEKAEKAESKDEKNNLLREQNNVLKRLVGDLQRQNRESGKQIALLEQQIAKVKEDYRNNFELLKTKFEDKEKEFELSHEENQKTNENLRNQLGLLKKMLEQRDNDFEQVRDKSSGLENEAKELLEENEALHDQLDQMEDEMKKKSNEILKYQNALEKSVEEKTGLMKKMQSMETTFQRKEEKIKKSVENQLSSLQKDVVKAVGSLKQEKIHKDNRIIVLNNTIEDYQQKNERINEQLMEYKERAQELSKACEEMEKKLEKFQLKNQRLEEQNMETKEKNQSLTEALEKMKNYFENELSFQQQNFDKITKETKETFSLREEQLRKKMQEKLDDELSLKNMQLKDLQREAEKKCAAKEDELRAVFKVQIEKLQTFLEDEVSKAEEEGKRSLEEARKSWLQNLEARLKHQDEMNTAKHSELQNETIELRSELSSKDIMVQQLKEEIKIKSLALQEKEESFNILSMEIDAKESEISMIHGEMAKIQAREEKLSVEHMFELRTLKEAMLQLEAEKDQAIQSLKENLQKQQSSVEALSRLEEQKGAEILSLNNELEEKKNMLEALKGNELEMYRALEEKDHMIHYLAERLEMEISAKESEISMIHGEMAQIQAREEKLSVEHMFELKSLKEAMLRLEEEKDQIIQSLKETLEKQQSSVEALSRLEGEKGAEILSLNNELEEKKSLLEALKRNELEMFRAIEEKDHTIHCLAERLETNQLAVESLTLSLEAKEQEISGIKSPLEDNVSNETKVTEAESRLKTLYEEKLSFLEAEKHSAIQLLEEELENVRQELTLLSMSMELKDRKADEYVAEINYLKKSIETPQVSVSLLKPDNFEEMNLLQEEKRKLEHDILKLQDTVKSFQQQHDKINQEAHKHKEPINPHESIEQLLERVPVNVVLNYLRTRITGNKQKISDSEAQDPSNAPDEQEHSGGANTKTNLALDNIMKQSFESKTLEKSKTPKDACEAGNNLVIGTSTVLSSSSTAASETLKTPKGACHTRNNFLIGISTVLSSSAAASDISKTYSDDAYDPKNDFSLGVKMIQSSHPAASEIPKTDIYDSRNITANSKEKFMTAITPKAKPRKATKEFPITPKAVQADADFVEEKIRSALALWEEKQSFSLSFEPDDSTSCGTAYGCDGSTRSSSQRSEIWGGKPLSMDDDNSKSISIYGCDETATLGDNTYLGIQPIRSSDSVVSECTFESHSIAAKQLISRSKAIHNLEDLLETESTPSNEISIDSVEDKLRTAIAKWENIQASYQLEQSSVELVVASGEVRSAFARWENKQSSYQPDQNCDVKAVVKGSDGDSDFYSCSLSVSTNDKSTTAADNSFVSSDFGSSVKSQFHDK